MERRMTTMNTGNEQLVRDLFAAVDPAREYFARNHRERMSDDSIWKTVRVAAYWGE
jgi:hypothetical protein